MEILVQAGILPKKDFKLLAPLLKELFGGL
jgi:hypothetical protein